MSWPLCWTSCSALEPGAVDSELLDTIRLIAAMMDGMRED